MLPKREIFRNPRAYFNVLLCSGTLLSACSNGSADNPVLVTAVETEAQLPQYEYFSGGCDRFGVYAQNQFEPYGAAVRREPNVLSEKLSSFAVNEVIAVDGWYDSMTPIYPTNSAPWDSGIWFRLANQEGWVSFPGVRGVPTNPETPDDIVAIPELLPSTPPECQLIKQ